MKEQNNNSFSWAGLVHTITLVLIVLKLAKVIDWSWLLVLLPTLSHMCVFLVIYIIICIFDWWINKNK